MARNLIFWLMLAAVLSFSGQIFAAEKIVASVSGVPITEAEVKRHIDQVMPFKVSFHSKIPKEKIATIQNEAVDKLIERAYKVCYARDHKITVPDQLLDDAMNKIKAFYKTDEGFEKAVAAETEAGLRASIYRDLVAKRAEVVVVEDKIQVTDEAVETYYNENKQSYFMPTQFRASHILIKVDPSSSQQQREDLKAKAKGLLARAKQGEDFYNLAYYNSDDRTKFVGGDLGYFHEGQAAGPFEDALMALQVGELSDLVKTRWGLHIVKLTEKNEPRQISFAEIKDKLRTKLEQQQREKLTRQWLDELKTKYAVVRAGE